jgi:hypothetical protein
VCHDFVDVLCLSMTGRIIPNQSVRRLTAKGYAESGTFYMTSITLLGIRFTLLEVIGNLNPLEVTLITALSDLWVASNQLNLMKRCGNETVTIELEPFLDNPCKAPKDTDYETTAENGSSGVNTAALNHSSLDLVTQDHSCTVLGARLLRSLGSVGRNVAGSQKASSELVRTDGASLCHLSKRDVVKAIPQIQPVRWFPAASLSGAYMETGSLLADLSWWKSANNEDRSAPERCADVQGLTRLGRM